MLISVLGLWVLFLKRQPPHKPRICVGAISLPTMDRNHFFLAYQYYTSPLSICQHRFYQRVGVYSIYKTCFNTFVTAPNQVMGKGVFMELFLSFIISVAAGVVAYYICKWLDGNK